MLQQSPRLTYWLTRRTPRMQECEARSPTVQPEQCRGIPTTTTMTTMKMFEGLCCGTRASDPQRAKKRQRSRYVYPVSAAAGLAAAAVLSSCASLADAFLASPPVQAGAAVGRPGRLGVTRMSPRAGFRMVSAAVGVDSSSATEEEGRGLSLGERLRADFPILDQVCMKVQPLCNLHLLFLDYCCTYCGSEVG